MIHSTSLATGNRHFADRYWDLPSKLLTSTFRRFSRNTLLLYELYNPSETSRLKNLSFNKPKIYSLILYSFWREFHLLIVPAHSKLSFRSKFPAFYVPNPPTSLGYNISFSCALELQLQKLLWHKLRLKLVFRSERHCVKECYIHSQSCSRYDERNSSLEDWSNVDCWKVVVIIDAWFPSAFEDLLHSLRGNLSFCGPPIVNHCFTT